MGPSFAAATAAAVALVLVILTGVMEPVAAVATITANATYCTAAAGEEPFTRACVAAALAELAASAESEVVLLLPPGLYTDGGRTPRSRWTQRGHPAVFPRSLSVMATPLAFPGPALAWVFPFFFFFFFFLWSWYIDDDDIDPIASECLQHASHHNHNVETHQVWPCLSRMWRFET